MTFYVCSIPNSGEEGQIKELFTEDRLLMERFIKAEDRPGRGVYECINPLLPGARRRSLETVAELERLYFDLDLQNIAASRDEAITKVRQLPVSTWGRDSGSGNLHVGIELKDPPPCGTPEYDRAVALWKRLAEKLAADPAPAHPAALIRCLGTHNTKNGNSGQCHQLWSGEGPLDLTELEELDDLLVEPLLGRKPKAGNGVAVPRAAGENKPPIDVDARFAAMRFEGPGDSAINITQTEVMGSLLRHHVALTEATKTVLEATQRAVANMPEANSWDWREEELNIAWNGARLINKDPTLVDRLPDDLRLKYKELEIAGQHPTIRKNKYSLFVSPARGASGMPSKSGTIREMLLKGTTHREILDTTGWPSCSIPAQARSAGLWLETWIEDGIKKYKGVPEDTEAPVARKPPPDDMERTARLPPREQRTTNSPPNKRRFKLVAFNDLRPGVEPLYLVDELIPIAGLVDVWGKAKCYKSFWCLDLMLHVAVGWEYRDRSVRQGAVVYCAFEGAHGYKKRIEGMRRKYNIENGTNVPLFVMPGQANLIMEHGVLINDIREQLGETCPVAVVLDTLNKSLFGSENKDVDMGAYVRAAEAIRDAFTCVVIIVHHCGYDDTRPRGHSSLPGAVDAQLAVTRAEEVVTVTVEMMRDGPEDTQVVSEAEVIEVGQDQNGKTLTTLVMVPSDAEAASRERHGWPRGLNVFHAALKAALAANGEVFQPEAGVLPVRAVNQWHVRERFYATYAEAEENSEKRTAKLRQAFNRALGEAQHRNIAKFVRTANGQEMVWLPARA